MSSFNLMVKIFLLIFIHRTPQTLSYLLDFVPLLIPVTEHSSPPSLSSLGSSFRPHFKSGNLLRAWLHPHEDRVKFELLGDPALTLTLALVTLQANFQFICKLCEGKDRVCPIVVSTTPCTELCLIVATDEQLNEWVNIICKVPPYL